MSWFTDIAGKAETFLNQIDKNAAAAINQAAAAVTAENRGVGSGSPRKVIVEPTILKAEDDEGNNGNNGFMVRDNTSNSNTFIVTSEPGGGGGMISNGIATSDGEGLISKGHAEKPVQQSSSRSSLNSKGRQKPKDAKNSHLLKKGHASTSATSTNSNSEGKSSIPKKDDESELIDFLNDPSRKELDEKLVLQTELANQAREVEMLYKTNKQLQAENEKFKSQLAKEADISKEGRVEEMESQLRQAETVQKNLKKLLNEKDSEVVKLKKSLDQSLEKLQQLEVLQATQNRLEVMEMEKTKLSQANEKLQEELTRVNETMQVSDFQVTSVKASLATLENEFASYKEKAKSILKQKDDFITSLQMGPSNHASGNSEEASNTESPYASEVHALKSERELLHAEISQCRSTIDSLKEDSQRLESELVSFRSQVFQVQKQLGDEKALSNGLHDENLQLRQQLSSTQYELSLEQSERRKSEELKLQQSDDSGALLQGRTSPMERSAYSNGDTEEALRMRITALTQSLLEKQGLINSLSSDKQLLQINVERLQEQMQQHRDDDHSMVNNSGFTQTVVSSKPLYLSESPWDSGMSTTVKRAFSTVDSMCCQAGLILRRRPNLRLGFCVYIVLLHFWVLFILFHSAPHLPQDDTGLGGGGGGAAPSSI